MRILCAPDSFKATLTAVEAADAMQRGIRSVHPSFEVDLCPIADGGEGTVEAIVRANGGVYRETQVTGPLGDRVSASWGLLEDRRTALIEASSAAGLVLVPEEKRDPTQTTTFGVGELIAAALDEGCRRVLVGIGGSATCDGGCGMAQALGVRFRDQDRELMQHPLTGADLAAIRSIDRSERREDLGATRLAVACDVTNPLCGPDGAAWVYGPQKGATAPQVRALDQGLAHLASLMKGVVDPSTPGMGAAGGLGFGLAAFAGAELMRGVDLVLDAIGFDDRLARADLVITGEGRVDEQTFSYGKAVAGVAARAAGEGKRVVVIAGTCVDGKATVGRGVKSADEPVIRTLAGIAGSEEEALARPAFWLERLAAEISRGL